jgi:hypothetical protein
MKESMLNKKNVHSYPSHIVAVIENGAIARPIVQRKLAAACQYHSEKQTRKRRSRQ